MLHKDKIAALNGQQMMELKRFRTVGRIRLCMFDVGLGTRIREERGQQSNWAF